MFIYKTTQFKEKHRVEDVEEINLIADETECEM